MENPNIRFLMGQLEATFAGTPWYGDPVMKKLEEIPHSHVMEVPMGLSNSVAKLVRHMIVWREYTLRKIAGDAVLKIELNTPDDWPAVDINTAADWEALVQWLKTTQEQLLEALRDKPDAWFSQTVPGKPQESFRELLEGIIHHDVYHLGQLVLVAKLVR